MRKPRLVRTRAGEGVIDVGSGDHLGKRRSVVVVHSSFRRRTRAPSPVSSVTRIRLLFILVVRDDDFPYEFVWYRQLAG
ncbi:MAG TPA: hypothetical protein VJB16_03520, partial [archaeon]|nr:hypothetical protein [archaeon]